MLRVVKNFAMSLNVVQGHSKLHCYSVLLVIHYVYLVPLVTYSMSNIGMTLKFGLGVVQDY